jgi:hypothetical protein
MKTALILSLLFISTLTLAAERPSNILDISGEDCESESSSLDKDKSSNIVTFERIKRLDDGSYWVNNIHLKSDLKFYRLKSSALNKKRICKDLGFKSHGGSRTETDADEKVVGVNGRLDIVSIKKTNSKFILNITCHK